MISKFKFYILFTCSLLSAGYASENDNDKESINTLSASIQGATSCKPDKKFINELIEQSQIQENMAHQMKTFRQKIYQAQQDINTPGLVSLKNEFDSLNISEELWETLCATSHVLQWPSQTLKKAYGGYIFYPHEQMKIINSHSENEYLVSRPDTLFSLVISASYGNPEAQLEAFKAFDCRSFFSTQKLTSRLYKEGKSEIEKSLNAPNLSPIANYLLAKFCYNLGCFDKRIEHYTKSGTLLSQLELLNTYRDYASFESPEAGRYLGLARQFEDLGDYFNAGRAYYESTFVIVDQSDKVNLLNQSCHKGYKPALLELGIYYRNLKNIEESNKYLLQYAKEGYSDGYLNYIDNIMDDQSEKLFLKSLGSENSDELIQKIINLLSEAVKLKNPAAAYRLGVFYQELSHHKGCLSEKEKYIKLSQEAFMEAVRLGDSLSLNRLDKENKTQAVDLQSFKGQFTKLYEAAINERL